MGHAAIMYQIFKFDLESSEAKVYSKVMKDQNLVGLQPKEMPSISIEHLVKSWKTLLMSEHQKKYIN